MAIIDRLKAGVQAFKTPNHQRYHDISAMLSDISGHRGGTNPVTGNIRDDNGGFAKAYTAVWYIRSAVDLYAQMAQDVPSYIVENKTSDPDKDKEVASSEDVRPMHIWYEVESQHRKQYGLNIISAMVYQMMLYDMLFVEKQSNKFGYSAGARVLNTLGVTINQNYGRNASEMPILSYTYSFNNESYVTFSPDEIAYEHGFNPFNDLYGSSIIESVIGKLNIDRNLDKFLRAFFINDARPSLYGSPTESYMSMQGGMGGLNDEHVATLRKILNDHHKGVDRFWRPLITSFPINWQVLDPPQIQQFTEMQQVLEAQVLGAFGVNPALLGMTEKTNYKEGVEIRAQFIQDRLRPVLSQVEAVINIHLLPFLTGSSDYRFHFDYSQYQLLTEQDVLRSQVAQSNYTSGLWTLNEARDYDNQLPVDGGDIFSNGVTLTQLASGETVTDSQGSQPTTPHEASEDTPNEDVSDETDTLESSSSEKTAQHADDCACGHCGINPTLSLDDYAKAMYQPLPSPESRLSELDSWRKFVQNNKHIKRTFNPVALRGDVADDIQVLIDSKASKSAILDAIDSAVKAIQATRIDYELAVEDLIEDARQEVITKQQFKLRMMQNIRAYCRLAFIDGLRDGGVVGQEPSDDELSTIESHVRKQREYVNNLADTIYGKGISDLEAINKPAMWWSKSISGMYDAGLASADANGMYEWVYGDTEHCKDCLALNGQRHRMKTYFSRGVLPQSDRLECNGFNCKCKLVRVMGNARGRLPNI